MGIGPFISDITPDSVEDAVADGVAWVGDRVEDAGNGTAGTLEEARGGAGPGRVRLRRAGATGPRLPAFGQTSAAPNLAAEPRGART